MAPKPSRDTLIHCDACGEDYSSTYRRCPFCGARNDPRRNSGRDDPVSASRYIPTPPPAQAPSRQGGQEEPDDGYVFDGQDAFDEGEDSEESYTPLPKGGKRLAPKQGGGGFDLPPINWPRLITFLCSLVIIVAALVIVFTSIYPQLRDSQDPTADASSSVSIPPASQAPVSPPSQNVAQPTPGQEAPTTPPSTAPVAEPTVTAITLDTYDFTLYVGEAHQMTAAVSPAGWTGQVTWTSSNPDWITVSDTGLVTNVNATGSYHNAFVTVSAGGVTARCEVRVISTRKDAATTPPPATQPPASQPPASQAPASDPPVISGGGPVVGGTGTIVNAEGGLRVRSGPGTSYEVLASLTNGNSVTVLADAGGGWYQISFPGQGQTMTGYIMGEYISSN